MSPGAGGTETGYTDLAEGLRERGYLAVVMGHKGKQSNFVNFAVWRFLNDRDFSPFPVFMTIRSEVLMLNKSLFAVFGLAMALALATPEKAHAGVAIGVTVGGPVVYPYAYVYPRPVIYPPAYGYRPYYYPGPVVYGAYYYHRPYWRHEAWERHERHERHEWREHHRNYYRNYDRR